MSQFNEHVNPINPITRTNKNFIYKGKEYPIDFSLVKKYSNFFYNNKSQFKFVHNIEIKPNNYELSEEVILMFIACCQNQPFDINDTNVFALHQLSIQYDVPVLNKLTSQCINKTKKSLVFQSIIFKLQNCNSEVNIDLSQEEEIIATNFFDYINDDQLLSLPISVLYRIINNDRLKLNSMSHTNQNQYIEFLFKCLDKYQRPASILFLNLDLENERIDLLSEIFNRYSNIFDFNLINSKFLAKNTSFILSELNKLKIEYSNKLNEIESENQKQKNLLTDFNNSKSEVLNSNQSFEERIQKLETDNQQKSIKLVELEEKLNQQAKILEKYTNLKVNKIQIVAEPKMLKVSKTVKLTTVVKPKLAFNTNVEWQIVQDVEGSVEVESMNEKSLILRCLKEAKKVTVVAKALDGSNVSDSIEIPFGFLEGTIEINVQQDQTIKGTIKIVERGGAKLDESKSKYILDTNSSQVLGLDAYESGYKLSSLLTEVQFTKPKGEYYLHVLVVDKHGYSKELVSKSLSTNGRQFCCKYTGSVQSVELNAGRYKLEAWGAQGGSFNTDYYGGYGGYSTGIINLQSKTTLYVVVGKSTDSTSGGYNGGGSGGVYTGGHIFTSYGGGGASHIGLKSGELTAFSLDYSSHLLIAASGGGGATGKKDDNSSSYNSIGGCGGGCCGAVGKISDERRVGTGATQSSGGKTNYKSDWNECGSFGHGSNCGNHPGGNLGGGGGSGFYGGGSGGNSGPGGGGSGYINTSKLEEASMCGFEVPTSSSTESKTYSTTNVSSDAISNYAKKGDGYVKITPL